MGPAAFRAASGFHPDTVFTVPPPTPAFLSSKQGRVGGWGKCGWDSETSRSLRVTGGHVSMRRWGKNNGQTPVELGSQDASRYEVKVRCMECTRWFTVGEIIEKPGKQVLVCKAHPDVSSSWGGSKLARLKLTSVIANVHKYSTVEISSTNILDIHRFSSKIDKFWDRSTSSTDHPVKSAWRSKSVRVVLTTITTNSLVWGMCGGRD